MADDAYDPWHVDLDICGESIVARFDYTDVEQGTIEGDEFAVTIRLRGSISMRPDGMSVEESAAFIVALLVSSREVMLEEGDEEEGEGVSDDEC